jgi:hypothetical protein
MGAKFSRRTIDEIREDVNRAVMLDHFLTAEGIGTAGTFKEAHRKARGLLDTIASEG